MRKSEIFAKITQIVVNVTEVDNDKIFSKDNHAEVVDARYMAIHFCHVAGLYNTDIASATHLSRRTVDRIVCGYEDRRRYSHPLFNIQHDVIASELRRSIDTTH